MVCILKSSCSDSGEGDAMVPNVCFLSAGGGESICDRELLLGSSIVSAASF